MDETDRQVVACNYAIATNTNVVGSLCYLLNSNPGSGGERVEILAHSRAGRWIQRWEAAWRLHNFRFKQLPPAHPLYERITDYAAWDEHTLREFNRMRDEERGRQLC